MIGAEIDDLGIEKLVYCTRIRLAKRHGELIPEARRSTTKGAFSYFSEDEVCGRERVIGATKLRGSAYGGG